MAVDPSRDEPGRRVRARRVTPGAEARRGRGRRVRRIHRELMQPRLPRSLKGRLRQASDILASWGAGELRGSVSGTSSRFLAGAGDGSGIG